MRLPIIQNVYNQIKYRNNAMRGTITAVNENGTYSVRFGCESQTYPYVPTYAKNSNLQIGDRVTVLFENRNREMPKILAFADNYNEEDNRVKHSDWILEALPTLPTLKESYLAPNATVFPTFYGDKWRGQVFLTTSAHTINYVVLLLAKYYSTSMPGTIYVEIKKVDGSNLPIEAVLTSGETDGNTLPYSWPGSGEEWRRIDLTEYNLEDATKYAITLHLIGGSSSHSAGIWNHHKDDIGDPYDDGGLVSSDDGGSSWRYAWYQDGGFKIYGK